MHIFPDEAHDDEFSDEAHDGERGGMKMRCLECGSEQAGDATECAGCRALIGVRPTGPAVMITSRRGTLRMDENGIRVKNAWWAEGVNQVIGWDEVRWLRDGPRFSRRTRWSLEIVLKGGGVVRSEAPASGSPSAAPQALQAIRQATRDHAIPAVFTGRPVGRFLPDNGIPSKAGLYPDPGDEPALREWDGTEWSSVLRTDPAGADSGGTAELATTWSPLPRQAQQQHAERAALAARNVRRGTGTLVVLGLVLAASALVVLGIACYWLAPPGTGVSGGAKTAVWAWAAFLALCSAGLLCGARYARRSVRRHERIAELAREAAWRASVHDVESPPGETWVVSGRRDTHLRFDAHEITLRTRRQTRWIAWDDVRWFRDGEYFHLSRRLRVDGWGLAIVLKNGGVVIPHATRKPLHASEEAITVARQAARRHAIPAVLTGRPVSGTPSPADKPGLYPDPGGEPGLREWTGTEWLPSLLVDPATSGPHGQEGPATIRSPLSRPDQQRQWDAAIAADPSRRMVAAEVIAIAVTSAACWAYLPVIAVVRGVEHGYWLGLSPAAAVLLYAAIFLCTCGWGALIRLPVRASRATGKVARAARAASAQAIAEVSPID